jgi:hypothetical protein
LLGFVVAFALREGLAGVGAQASAAVWVTDGQETRVQLANVTLPMCVGEAGGTEWSPPMFVLPWTDDHDGPLPWTGNTGTTHLTDAGFTSGSRQVLAHVHVIWNTTMDAKGEVVSNLEAGRVIVHFMVPPADHNPPCSVSVPFVRSVPLDELIAAAATPAE